MCSTKLYTQIFIVALLIIPHKTMQTNEQNNPQITQPKYPQIVELLK